MATGHILTWARWEPYELQVCLYRPIAETSLSLSLAENVLKVIFVHDSHLKGKLCWLSSTETGQGRM